MNEKIRNAVPHLMIIGSLFLGTLWVLDQLNPMMGFLSNSTVNVVLFVFCILALVSGIQDIRLQCAKSEEAENMDR